MMPNGPMYRSPPTTDHLSRVALPADATRSEYLEPCLRNAGLRNLILNPPRAPAVSRRLRDVRLRDDHGQQEQQNSEEGRALNQTTAPIRRRGPGFNRLKAFEFGVAVHVPSVAPRSR
jgi:hypothetical protein